MAAMGILPAEAPPNWCAMLPCCSRFFTVSFRLLSFLGVQFGILVKPEAAYARVAR